MAIYDELTQLQTELQSVVAPANLSPIKRVYITPTQSAPTTDDLPCIVLFFKAKDSIIGFEGDAEQRVTTYTAQLLYAPTGQSTLADNYADILQYHDPVLDQLWAHVRLGGTANVIYALPKDVTQPMKVTEQWSGQDYFGMEFRIECKVWRAVTIGA